jgi:hypothetical protein
MEAVTEKASPAAEPVPDDFFNFFDKLAEDKPRQLRSAVSPRSNRQKRAPAAAASRTKAPSTKSANVATPQQERRNSIKHKQRPKRARRQSNNGQDSPRRRGSIDSSTSHVSQLKVNLLSDRETMRNAKHLATSPQAPTLRRNSIPDNLPFHSDTASEADTNTSKKLDLSSKSNKDANKHRASPKRQPDERPARDKKTGVEEKGDDEREVLVGEGDQQSKADKDGRRDSTRRATQSRALTNMQNIQDNLKLGSFEQRAAHYQAIDQCAVLFSKASLTVVEGGACDFLAVRLSHPPTAPVFIEVIDKSGEIKTLPKLIVFEAGKESREQRPRGSPRGTSHDLAASSAATHRSIQNTTEAETCDATDARSKAQGTSATPESLLESEAHLWDHTQLIRVTAIDDDAAEESQEVLNLKFKIRSKDIRFSSHRQHNTCVYDPAVVKVSVIDNDGKFIYQFGDLFGPYGAASGLHRAVHQFPVRLDLPKRSRASCTNNQGGKSQNQEAKSTNVRTPSEPRVGPHFTTPRGGPTRRMKRLLAGGIPTHCDKRASNPPVVPLASNFRMAGSGGHHIGLLQANGMVYFQGAGEHGQLGGGAARSDPTLSAWAAVDADGLLRSGIRAGMKCLWPLNEAASLSITYVYIYIQLNL